MEKEKSKALIKRDEGVRCKAYRDSEGIWTIGVGHNMEIDPEFSVPYGRYALTAEQVDRLFESDFKNMLSSLMLPVFYEAYEQQNEARQAVMENMMFNMGAARFGQFKRFLAAMRANDYITAAKEMQDSRWWHQVGDRAKRLQAIILNGCFEG